MMDNLRYIIVMPFMALAIVLYAIYTLVGTVVALVGGKKGVNFMIALTESATR